MKICLHLIFTILLVISLLVKTSHGELARIGDVQQVTENWLRIIVQEKRHWAGSTSPKVTQIEELKRGGRILGYYVQVEPLGFMIVSRYKELAPIKVYSDMGSFDPDLETGLSGFIKDSLARVLDSLEAKLGSARAAVSEDIGDALQINYRKAWTELGARSGTDGRISLGEIPASNYRGGQVLLATEWDQVPPYNNQCPSMGCDRPPCYFNQNAMVGCVPLAGAQVMRFWNWPPYGEGSPYNVLFDWPNMPDTLTLGQFPPYTCNPPQVQVDAVAQLCALVGQASISVHADGYGCEETGAFLYDPVARSLLDAFEDDFRYDDEGVGRDRDDYGGPEVWFNRIKFQLNQNRPIPYAIRGANLSHAIVVDGWQEIGATPLRQYHINWGHGEEAEHEDRSWKNFWYTVDAIYGSDFTEEEMLENIVPENAVGPSMAGVYSALAFPYRYFDQDTSGSNALFGSGQMLQTLEGVRITGTDTAGYYVRFIGSSTSPTRIYTGGDPSKGIGIRGTASRNGAIRLANNGGISLSRLQPPRYPRAVAVSPYQINLSWEKGRGMDTQQFVIERKIGDNGNFSYLTTVGATFYADIGLNPLALYTYRVKTVEPTGIGSTYSMEFFEHTPSL